MSEASEALSPTRASAATWSGSRKIWPLVAVLVVVVVLVGIWARSNNVLTSGPLGYPHDGETVISFDGVRVGEMLTYGAVVVRNRGVSAVTLRSATLVGESDSLTVDSVLVAGPDRKYGVDAGRGDLPSVSEFGVRPVPIAGAMVQSSSAEDDPGTEILVRMVIKEVKIQWFRGLRVEYEYRGEEYTYTDPIRLEICPVECVVLGEEEQ